MGSNNSRSSAVVEDRPSKSEEKRTSDLELAIGQIEKQFGQGAIMRLGEASAHLNIEAIPTGALSLDLALGIGGVPRGRITEIFGPESAGKSTLAQHIIAQAQAAGGMAAYIDVEHALEPTYAAACGVKIDELLDLAARHRRAGARDHARRSCAATRSTSSSSIAWPRSCRAPRSRARWATRCPACRRA